MVGGIFLHATSFSLSPSLSFPFSPSPPAFDGDIKDLQIHLEDKETHLREVSGHMVVM